MGVSIWDQSCMLASLCRADLHTFRCLCSHLPFVLLFVSDAALCRKSWFCYKTHVRSVICQELVSQRQKVREERERLQAQLEHFRRCLTLPNIHWGRGQVNGHTPRWPLTRTLWHVCLWRRRNRDETHWSRTTLCTWSTWRSQSLSCYLSGQSVVLPDWFQIQLITCYVCHSKPWWPYSDNTVWVKQHLHQSNANHSHYYLRWLLRAFHHLAHIISISASTILIHANEMYHFPQICSLSGQ